MSKPYSKFSKVTNINRRKIFQIYKRDYTSGKYNIKSQSEFNLILKTLLKNIASDIIESTGGVIVKGLGYFGVWKCPRKIINRSMVYGKLSANFHTNGYPYFPYLFTDVYYNNTFKGWSLDSSFNKDIKKGISKKLKNGTKYKLNYTLVKGMFNTKFNINENK